MCCLFDLSRRHDGRQRKPSTDGLRQGEDVRHDAVPLEGEHITRATDAGLCLVEDEQHSAFAAFLLQGAEIAPRQLQHATAGQDRFGDKGRQTAGRLAVHQVEGIVELGAPIQRTIGVLEAWTEAVGRWNCQGSNRRRSIALTPSTVGRRGGDTGHAMPALRESDNFVLAGHQLSHADGGLVRLRSGRQQQHPVKTGRQGG